MTEHEHEPVAEGPTPRQLWTAEGAALLLAALAHGDTERAAVVLGEHEGAWAPLAFQLAATAQALGHAHYGEQWPAHTEALALAVGQRRAGITGPDDAPGEPE